MRRILLGLMAATAGLTAGTTAHAQSGPIEGRVDKLEREMRAVQRKVFPGGSGMTVEPQITAPPPAPTVTGTPATSALNDLTARIASLESQQTSITGQVEQMGFKMRQLEEGFAAYRAATDRRLAALEGAQTVTPASVAAAGDTGDDAPVAAVVPVAGPAARPAATPPRASAAAARPAAAPTAAPAAARASPERVAAVAAVERPDTGDAGEDAYTYGYRLWQANFYPEAQAQLKVAAEKHPRHRRASYAQNLLGRAYLDEGKPALASVAFYDSYKKWPDGERAAESLMYLGQSLTRLKKPADACKVYDELADVYAGRMASNVQAGLTKGRADAKCA